MLITEDQLKEWLGIERRTPLMRKLQELKIPYGLGGGGRICTTLGAIDRVLIGEGAVQEEEITFA